MWKIYLPQENAERAKAHPPCPPSKGEKETRIADCGMWKIYLPQENAERAKAHPPLPPFKGGERNAEKKRYIPPAPLQRGRKKCGEEKAHPPCPPSKGEKCGEEKAHPPCPPSKGEKWGVARRRRSAGIAQGNALGKGNPPFVEPCRGDLVGAAARVLGQLGRPLQGWIFVGGA
jgi:hypothetical protein